MSAEIHHKEKSWMPLSSGCENGHCLLLAGLPGLKKSCVHTQGQNSKSRAMSFLWPSEESTDLSILQLKDNVLARKSRRFESGVKEAIVARLERASQNSGGVPFHLSPNR